jgi:hypothetical protein
MDLLPIAAATLGGSGIDGVHILDAPPMSSLGAGTRSQHWHKARLPIQLAA